MSKKQKLNLIEELTTHKCDYKVWPLYTANTRSDFRSREKSIARPPPQHIVLDPQSHAPYSPSVHVPFDLYLAPKPIVGTDPRECFETKKLSKKLNRENSELPTLLPPTLPLAQIEDEEALNVILHYTYTQMHKINQEDAALKIPNKELARTIRVTTEGTNLKYKPCLYPPLPPGWITAARHWDALQTRTLGDPFKTFWSRRGPDVECSCCCNPLPNALPQETKEEIEKFINEDRLRLPYNVTKVGYQGYRPICAKGVPLEKKSLENFESLCQSK